MPSNRETPSGIHTQIASQPSPAGLAPSFTHALFLNIAGLVIILGLALLIALLWQGVASTRKAAHQEISVTLDQAVGRLRILVNAAEMTTTSAERIVRTVPVTGARLRSTLENALAAFEQRPELSYLGIILPDTGEYGNLERTAEGQILLWLFPGGRAHDPVTRVLRLTPAGFLPYRTYPTDGYDPRVRPFYLAAVNGPAEGTWIPAYPWIVHAEGAAPLWGLSYVKALRANDGELMGVLDTDIDLPALNRFLSMLSSEYRSQLQIVELGDTPRLIAGPGVQRVPQPLSGELATLITQSKGTFADHMELEGERRWVAARRMDLQGGLSWMVVASRAVPVIEAPLRQQLFQVFGIGLLIVAGLVLMSIHLARRFGKPLAELEQRVARIARNDLGPSTPRTLSLTHEFRETQMLGKALDQAALAIRQQAQAKEQEQARLLAFNAELEQRVAERTAELNAINQELESFCHSVSHDLRSPLRGIAGFSEILVKQHAGNLDTKARHYLGRVQAATQRMGHLIDDLLELSRVSRQEMHREPTDLSAMARDILDNLREGAPERTVDVRIQDGMLADGDPRLLRIMLENLLGNAWKFTARTADAHIAFTAAHDNGAATFSIRDNGAGFDMRYAGKLFGPFQRLHRDADFPGTGIGLATVLRIVNRHGGRITAHAEPDKGATFQFSLS